MGNKAFIHEDFLLDNRSARILFHEYAETLPIIDYHNHLPPEEIASDRVFGNLSRVWINGDHYKWRAMRTLGIGEELITGNAPDREKFRAWARTVPHTLRNPLYHWTHLELARYFDEYDALNEDTADRIYDKTAEKLSSRDYSCRKLLDQMKVEVVCTTEDPTDDLRYHKILKESDYELKVSTAFRPDKVIHIEREEYLDFLTSLESVSGIEITGYRTLCEALEKRMKFFDGMGCRLSDHGLDRISDRQFTEKRLEEIFSKRKSGKPLSVEEGEEYKSGITMFLAESYHELGWVQQFHLGALRNNNSRMLRALGPDTGWDSIGDFSQARSLSTFLNGLDQKNKLSKTIIYNVNPAYNEVMATMTGNFMDGTVKGKMQFGSAWWFLDQKEGIIKQLNTLSNMGLLSCFVGMLTDSRSFLSFPRHEYFRRVLCNLLGGEMECGELPNDMRLIGKLVTDICYNNAKEYFEF